MSIELDELDKLAASVFDGYLVRKDLVRKYSRQYPVPTYVVEFLLGRYCASVNESEIAEGLEIVEKQLKDRTVRTGEEELNCSKPAPKRWDRSRSSTFFAQSLTQKTIAMSRNFRA
jgi:predicted ATP-dependent Lon-type protease